MKKSSSVFFIIFILQTIVQSEGINNLQLRGCLDNATEEDIGHCYKELTGCFSQKECGDEFSTLFMGCEIPMNDQPTDLKCFEIGKQQSIHPDNINLIRCFDEYCGMFGGKPQANLEEIQKNIKDNIESSKKQLEEDEKQMHENEEYRCVRTALTDPEKCYNAADNCDEACAEDLDKLRQCTGDDENNCIYNIQNALPKLETQSGIELSHCLIKYCYSKQANQEEAEEKQQVQIQEEL